MPYVLEKQSETESWLAAALRHAAPRGLEVEVHDRYARYVAAGETDAHAAYRTCAELDLLCYEEADHPWAAGNQGRRGR